VRAAAVSLILVVLPGAALTGCGSSSSKKILNTERVERAIEQSILEKRRLRANVTCPSGVEQKKGVKFHCTAYYKGGKTPFLVTEDDAKGAVHYIGLKSSKN
jgi:hypothetical protein